MNRNILYSQIFVDELARAGLKSVCIAPGSRSTPLTMAFAKHEGIKVYSHLDERSMAFFALGLALAGDEPVAILCTSGSAAANFFPAIVEAHQSRVPLLVLTADRPPELRHSGANQTIDQVKMFGDYALWFVDAALPEANPPAVAIRNLRTLAARAYAKANGIRKGVVHINLPFRAPLEPTPVESDFKDVPVGAEAREENLPFTYINKPHAQVDVRGFFELLPREERGWIICGPNSLNPEQAHSLIMFSQWAGYTVFADAVSGVRFAGQYTDSGGDHYSDETTVSGYDTFLPYAQLETPGVIIRIGSVPTSKALNQLLTSVTPKFNMHFSPSGEWADDSHLATHFFHSNSIPSILELFRMIFRPPGQVIETQFKEINQTTWQTIDHEIATGSYFDGAAVYDVVDLIPPESTLFAGNSLAVRHLDQFGKPTSKRIFAYANRGASGIDGNISTALGAGAARPDKPLVAIVGDITFYHDMNGLLAVHRCGVPVTIVLLNNNGGGIFHRLPIKDYDPEFTDLWITPHGLDFSHAAKLYGLEYVQVTEREAFRQAFSASVNNRTSAIIEVRTNAKQDLARRSEIMKAVQEKLRTIQD